MTALDDLQSALDAMQHAIACCLTPAVLEATHGRRLVDAQLGDLCEILAGQIEVMTFQEKRTVEAMKKAA